MQHARSGSVARRASCTHASDFISHYFSTPDFLLTGRPQCTAFHNRTSCRTFVMWLVYISPIASAGAVHPSTFNVSAAQHFVT